MRTPEYRKNEVKLSKARAELKNTNGDDLEILDYYNSMIWGFYNYYCIANNSSIINSYKYIMEYSMYKTYGTKYRTSIHKVIEKFRVGKDFVVKFQNAKGVEHMRVFYNQGFKRQKKAFLFNEDIPFPFLPNAKPSNLNFRIANTLTVRLFSRLTVNFSFSSRFFVLLSKSLSDARLLFARSTISSV